MPSYSALMLAPRITFPHFSVSSTTNLLKSSDAIAFSSTPNARRRASKRRIGKTSVDLLVESADNLGGCIFRRADSEPRGRLIARHELT